MSNQTQLFNQKITDVSSTLFITLYAHALESQKQDAVLHDPTAIRLTKQLNPELAQADSKLLRDLAQGKMEKPMVRFIALRARHFDRKVQAFLQKHPHGVVVSLGCGLDPRFQRIDNGQVEFYDLDLPEVIAIKQTLLEETDRYHLIAQSVLDLTWLDKLTHLQDRPFLFLAEGLLMYLPAEEVKNLVLTLQQRFAGCELVCEVFNKMWLDPRWQWMMKAKLQGQLNIGEGAVFQFGIGDSGDLEDWHAGIELLGDWSYFDAPELSRLIRVFGKVGWLRKTQWVVHYRLN